MTIRVGQVWKTRVDLFFWPRDFGSDRLYPAETKFLVANIETGSLAQPLRQHATLLGPQGELLTTPYGQLYAHCDCISGDAGP